MRISRHPRFVIHYSLFLAAVVAPVAAKAGEAEVKVLLEAGASAAEAGDFKSLLATITAAAGALEGKALVLFYQGALIALENATGDRPDAAEEEALASAYLAGRFAGLSQRHLHMVESNPLPAAGWGARLAAESVASYYYLGRLLSELPALKPEEESSIYIVYFAAALRHWLGLDARQSAETAAVLSEWQQGVRKAGIAFSFEYLADLSTSKGLGDGHLPADAAKFYKVSKDVEARLLCIFRRRPEAVIVLAAAEAYAYPYRYRWLEPAGLTLEHLKEAGIALPAATSPALTGILDNIKEQLQNLEAQSRVR